MSNPAPRDYYTHLFTQDSVYTEFQDENIKKEGTIDNGDTHVPRTSGERNIKIFLDNMKILMDELDVDEGVDEDTIYIEDNSDMSISDTSDTSSDMITDARHSNSDKAAFADMHQIQGMPPDNGEKLHGDIHSTTSFDSLDTAEEVKLLRNNSLDTVQKKNASFHKLLKLSLENHVKQTEYHTDTIGTFNIQNKYDHCIATQLFLKGDFTFLALQEPFASHDKTPDTWKKCRRMEVQSARLCCWETHHQVIMYDSWKWGGKVISHFNNLFNGRIISIAFEFGNNQKLGIISIYAVAGGGHHSEEQKASRLDIRKSCVFAVQQICKK